MLIATEGGGLKSRAFTLIELLAVIIIIGVIALIVTPVIIGVINKTERGAFERSIDGLLETVRLDYSTDDFVSPREYYYEGKDLILLTVAEETKDENVGIKGKIDGKGFIYIDEEGLIHIENICSKKYCASGEENKIEITENESGIIPEVGKNDPMIRLIGAKTIYVNLNETYEEPGVVAKTKSGKVLEYTSEITLNGEIVTNIDTSVDNTYMITYKTENEGKEVSVTRNIVVLDMKPEITMIPEETTKYVSEQEVLITVSVVRPNTLTSFIVEVKKDGEVISPEIIEETEISKRIKLSKTGIYEVKVTVTDNNNHKSTVTRTYKIDSEAPVITFTDQIELKANEVSGFNLMEDKTVKVRDNKDDEPTWWVEGNLNSITEKEVIIKYIAQDEAGNKREVERTIYITPADGPDINSSSAGSNGIWLVGPQDITIFARIIIDNDELTSFSYQVDDGEEINVPITDNKQAAETIVTLNETGKHTITIKAIGKHYNEKEKTIGEFWIDADKPIIGNIEGNTATWTADKTLTATLTDSDSKVKYYAFKDNAIEPEENSSEWVSIESPVSPYHFSQRVILNGTYYLWAKDSAGNVSEVKSVVVNRIDEKVPELTVNNYRGDYGIDKSLETLSNATYGGAGGTVVCKDENRTVTNIKDIIVADDHNITCTAIGNNGKKSETKNISLSFTSRTFDTVMTGSDIATADPDSNKRYVGKNPNNYVWFNGEKWRIIGLFHGQAKIMRDKAESRAWDNTSANGDHGGNDWSKASLQKELNSIYFDAINIISKNYIDESHIWNIGGWNNRWINRSVMYEKERGTTVYPERPTIWQGAIGLIYPSDYGYSTNGSDICNTTSLLAWKSAEALEECTKKSWLYDTSIVQWTITPDTNNNFDVIYIGPDGGVPQSYANDFLSFKPTVYLKSTVKIKGGTGTSDDPYILGTDFYDINCAKTKETIMGKSVAGCFLKNDPDKNLRYVGSNPSNYVKFNNELWRIIGVFDGKTKIMRSEAIGGKRWDETEANGGHGTDGLNDWTTSTLQSYLKNTYYPTLIGKEYVVANYTWHIGGWSADSLKRELLYQKERSDSVYPGRQSTWLGPIGLIYPSDYLYSSSGGSVCDQTNVYNWSTPSVKTECVDNAWVYMAYDQWSMMPHIGDPSCVFYIYRNGSVSSCSYSSYNSMSVRPVVYLDTSVKIKSGAGTISNPYTIGK